MLEFFEYVFPFIVILVLTGILVFVAYLIHKKNTKKNKYEHDQRLPYNSTFAMKTTKEEMEKDCEAIDESINSDNGALDSEDEYEEEDPEDEYDGGSCYKSNSFFDDDEED